MKNNKGTFWNAFKNASWYNAVLWAGIVDGKLKNAVASYLDVLSDEE